MREKLPRLRYLHSLIQLIPLALAQVVTTDM